ncbi:T9SS type B sorting domain-containing protein, partial [Phaeodactylibacter luteus]
DTGDVTVILQNQYGCDSVVVTSTALLPTDSTFISLQSCSPADTGHVTVILQNQFGCDSVVVTSTALLPTDSTFVFLQSCSPADTGHVTVILQNQFGCDSVVVTSTALLPTDSTFISLQSCSPADTGHVTVILQNQFGCDSVVVTSTALLPTDSTFISLQSCSPADTGDVTVILQNQFGCDSVVVTSTALLPTDSTFISLQSCSPADTGDVTVILQNQFGCDSVVVTSTALLPQTIDTLKLNLCPGDSLLINGTYYHSGNTNGVDTLVSSNGCDSILIIAVDSPPAASILTVKDTLCAGDFRIINGQTYNSSNPTGRDTVSYSGTGCDSLIISVDLFFSAPEVQYTVLAPGCPGESSRLRLDSIYGGVPPYVAGADGGGIPVNSLPVEIALPLPEFSLHIEDLYGCRQTYTGIADTLPPFQISLPDTLYVLAGSTIALTPAWDFPLEEAIWAPAAGLECTDCPVALASPEATTRYTLQLATTDGCLASAEVLVIVEDEPRIFTPSGFSPNGDGQNERFRHYSRPGHVTSTEHFEIYNRWGQLMYQARDIPGEATNWGWDGMLRGEPANTGVYAYRYTVLLGNGQLQTYAGTVTLMR